MNKRQAARARRIARGNIYASRVTIGPMWHDGAHRNIEVLAFWQGEKVEGVPAVLVRDGGRLLLSPVTYLEPAQ